MIIHICQPEGPVQVKPKKPAGAVSMFGGMDPSALRKKKNSLTLDTDSKADHTVNEPLRKKTCPQGYILVTEAS